MRFNRREEDSHAQFLDVISHTGSSRNDSVLIVEFETDGDGGTHRERGGGFNEHAAQADVAREGQ